jgi:signal peptidase
MLSSLSSSLTNARQSIAQALNFALVLSTAFMLWKGLSVASASSSPIVVVLSGSMEPAFQRGDLLFLWNRSPRAEVGEVVVYNVRGKDIPIVHRVVRTYPEIEGKAKKVKEVTVYVLDTIWKLFGVDSLGLASVLTRSSNSTPNSHMLLTKVR